MKGDKNTERIKFGITAPYLMRRQVNERNIRWWKERKRI
jgi:hypothetical protein